MESLYDIYEQGKYILPLFIRDIALGALDASSIEFLFTNSDVINAALPILMDSPFLQKYFKKGILLGAIKG